MTYELYEVNGRKCVRAQIPFTFKERADSWLGGKVDLYRWTCPYCDKEQPCGIPYVNTQPPPQPHVGPAYEYCCDCLQEWRWNPDRKEYSAVFDPLDEEGIAIRIQKRTEYNLAVAAGLEDEYIRENWK